MAATKKSGRRKDKKDQEDKLCKEDEAIAKFVRFNTPTETTMFQSNEVHYFTASKAIDALVTGKYGEKAKKDPQFPNRSSAEIFLQRMLEGNLFFRVKKLVPKKKEDKEKEADRGDESARAGKSPLMEKAKSKKEKEQKKEKEEKTEQALKKEAEVEEKEEKKKKKVKLEVHAVQVFKDGSDVYVWVFDPTPLYKQLIGLLMVVATIVGCLFPLWPMWLRLGVYYLSIAGIGFFGVVLGVALLRTILFAIIWLVTMGEHKLWILPNLVADVGILESFHPLYTYERASEEKDKKKKKDKKDKNSDDENTAAVDVTDQDLAESKEKAEKGEESCKVEEKKEEESVSEEEGDREAEKGEESMEDEEAEGSEASSSQTGSEAQLMSESAEEKSKQPIRRRRVRKDDGDFVIIDK